MDFDFDGPVVTLKNVHMTPELCNEVCSLLLESETVTSLDFSRNEIGDDGCDHIARLLTANKHISSLNLSHNRISDSGAILIARAARRHGTLQNLNLSGNPIAEAGVTEIARLVQSSDQLAELVLLDTMISVRAAMALAEAMITNFSLLYVSLPFTLGFAVLEEVQKIVLRNFARRHRVDEQLNMARAATLLLSEQQKNRAKQWSSVQSKAEPESSRTRIIRAPLLDWADSTQHSALLYLSLLDKKAPLVARDSARAAAAERTPRGRGVPQLPTGNGITVKPRVPDLALSSSLSKSLTTSGMQVVALPPLVPHNHYNAFTISFQHD